MMYLWDRDFNINCHKKVLNVRTDPNVIIVTDQLRLNYFGAGVIDIN